MYIPIVYGVDVYGPIPVFLGFFYKFVQEAQKYNWPIIAQKQYFVDPKEYEKKYNYDISNVFKVHSTKKITKKDLEDVKKYIFPDEIDEDILLKNNNDKDEAWINLMAKSYKSLEEYLKSVLKEIDSSGNKIKGLLVFRHNQTIYEVAKELNIPVIELEFTSLRYPFYNEIVSYFQFENKYSTGEFETRYKNFKEEDNMDLPVLTRKEMLALFLSRENIHYLNKMDSIEEYELGVALGLEKDYESKSTNSKSNEEVIETAKTLFENRKILYRPHPSIVYKFQNDYTVDNSANSIEFILRCKRVMSCLSNTAFEAMLYGKTAYINGKMPFKSFGAPENEISEEVLDLKRLNYILFAFFAPYELVLDKDYLDWRLSKPSETEIYLRHMEYYLSKRNIGMDVLKKPASEKRLKIILKLMNYKTSIYYNLDQRSGYNELKTAKDIIEENKKTIVHHEEEILIQKSEIERLTNLLNNIYNSKYWKMLEPLRKIKNKVRK